MSLTADRIRQLRINKKWTQLQLAQMAKMERKSVIRYENGENIPNGKALISLARIFGVSVDYLLGITDLAESLSDEEKNIITTFRDINSEAERERFLNNLKTYV